MKGDDIMVQDNFIGSDGAQRVEGKVSVSITYSQNGVAIGHTGLNIKAGSRAPGFAYSSNLTDVEVKVLMESVCEFFDEEVKDIGIATTKVIV